MKALEKIDLPKNEREAIEIAFSHIKKRFPVKKTVLFGSKARGESDAYSDIDIIFITSRALHWKEEKAIIDTLFEIGMEYDVIFSPLFATDEEWSGGIFTEFPIYSEIIKDGAMMI